MGAFAWSFVDSYPLLSIHFLVDNASSNLKIKIKTNMQNKIKIKQKQNTKMTLREK